MAVKAVFFDVGETLVDETRYWSEWADWLGVPRFTFMAELGAAIARGEHHRSVFDRFRPGFDFEASLERRRGAGWHYSIERADLYADAVPCLAALRARGYLVGIAGNQFAEAEAALRALDVPADIVATSASWGVEKPSPPFFERLLETVDDAVGLNSPDEVAYVGDHPENDVAAAHACGLTAVFLRRGPWAMAHAASEAAGRACLRVESLSDLPDALREIGWR
jgi:FMN phosphatase YigB (HAD superfamily)